MRLQVCGITLAGRRAENQDAVALPVHGLLTDGQLMCASAELTDAAVLIALADGVGGRPDGRWAARSALAALCAQDIGANSKSLIAAAITTASRALSRDGKLGLGPATTLAGISVNLDTMLFFHVGDSRIYSIGEVAVSLLTNDHRSRSDGRSITRYLGSDAHAIPTIISTPLAPGNYFLATDGLYAFVKETDFLLLSEFAPETALPMLVDTALQNGSNDNISAVAIQIE